MTDDELKFWNYLIGKPQQGNTFQGGPKDVGKKFNLSDQQIQELQDKYKTEYFKGWS